MKLWCKEIQWMCERMLLIKLLASIIIKWISVIITCTPCVKQFKPLDNQIKLREPTEFAHFTSLSFIPYKTKPEIIRFLEIFLMIAKSLPWSKATTPHLELGNITYPMQQSEIENWNHLNWNNWKWHTFYKIGGRHIHLAITDEYGDDKV